MRTRHEPVKLISFIGSCDIDIVDEWIVYYLELGISPEDFLITLHSQEREELLLLFDKFKKHGIRPLFSVYQKFTSRTKLVFLEEMRLRCDDLDWILRADADEFCFYNESVKDVIKYCELGRFDYVIGHWLDMVAEGGELLDVADSQSLFETFPLCTHISIEKFKKKKTSTSKMVLARKRISPCSGGFHSPGDNDLSNSVICDFYYDVLHFKWRSNICDKMGKRSKEWHNKKGKREGIAFLEEVKGHRIDISGLEYIENLKDISVKRKIIDADHTKRRRSKWWLGKTSRVHSTTAK